MKTSRSWIKRRQILLALAIATFAVPTGRAQVGPGDFDVTEGKIERAPGKRLKVLTKEMRARLKFTTEQSVTLKFTYLGPTKEVARLSSREVPSQFGIKLRAHDDCNVVYVMWRFAPDQKITVSVKRNPGKRTHAECLDHGYINNIKPRIVDIPQRVEVNHPHVLTTSMSGSDLTVTADNKMVWWGDLGPVALSFNGPVGLESDNARVVFDLLVSR
jgi:hypothetical protein